MRGSMDLKSPVTSVRSRAFELFVKGTHSHGHGLGLAFVDAVPQTHGGRIATVSNRPTGSAVVTLCPL